MLSVVDAGNFGDRQVHDAAFVRIERTELLIEAGLLGLLGKKLRHLPQLDVLALAVVQRIDEDPLFVRQRAAERHVDDVLQRLERLAAMPHQQFGLVARQVEARAVGGLFDVDRRLDARAPP